MRLFSGKYSLLISVLLLAAVLASWQSPVARVVLLTLFLLFSVARAFASVLGKHRAARLRGRITRAVFLRSVLVETVFLALVMVLAGTLGRTIAQLAAGPIGDDFLRFAAGIVIGLSVGVGVGVVMHSLWRRLVKASTRG